MSWAFAARAIGLSEKRCDALAQPPFIPGEEPVEGFARQGPPLQGRLATMAFRHPGDNQNLAFLGPLCGRP